MYAATAGSHSIDGQDYESTPSGALNGCWLRLKGAAPAAHRAPNGPAVCGVSLLSLLCQEIDGWWRRSWDRVGRLQQSPDVAGEVALEAADRFAGALAFAAAAGDVVAGGLVAAGAGDDDAVQRGVDLAVAALVEALALGVA